MTRENKGYNLEDRLIDFAVRIINFVIQDSAVRFWTDTKQLLNIISILTYI